MVSNEDISRRRLIEWCDLADDTREDDIPQRLLDARHVGPWRNYDEFIEPLKRKLAV
ncbi:MAG: hypothetical protein OES46_18845 [Gammaproteobacteria bacterium]|jgi:hypothetical protein|nr:hypothetical protein [Gammaproteobacteria bacterium]